MEKICEEEPSWDGFWDRMEKLFPKLENDISIRDQIRKLPSLPKEPTPHEVEVLLMDLNFLLSKMSPDAMSPQEKTLTLVGKIHPTAFKDLRADRKNHPKCEDFHLLAQLLREKAVDDTLEKHIYQQQKEPKAFPKEQKLNVVVQGDYDMEQGAPEHQPLGKGKGKGKGLGKSGRKAASKL